MERATELADWAALPEPLLLAVFARLPLDTRCCAAVACRRWRAVAAERSLWRHVDFAALFDPRSRHAAGGVPLEHIVTAARCEGVLETLDASGLQPRAWSSVGMHRPFEDAQRLVRTHAATLRDLRLPAPYGLFSSPSPDELRRLAAAGPGLRELRTPCEAKDLDVAVEALTLQPPLRLSGLHVWLPSFRNGDYDRWDDFCAALTAVPAPLQRLSLTNVDLHDGAEPLASALRVADVRRLELREVGLYGELDAPDLPDVRGRVLGEILDATLLTHLLLKSTYFASRSDGTAFFSAAAADALAPALRAAACLLSLELEDCLLFRDVPAAAALLTACTAHPSLRTLSVGEYYWGEHKSLSDGEAAAVGAALEALVTTRGTLLRTLSFINIYLGDVAVGPLVDALPRAPRLRRLSLSRCKLSPAFCAERLLPATRAAPRMVEVRTLDDSERERDENPAAAEAQELAFSRLRRDPLPFIDGDEDMPTDDEENFPF